MGASGSASDGRKGRVSTAHVVRVSLFVDLLDVVTNLVVASITGSAVVFAEMAQGLADAIGSTLLFVGHRRSRRPRDRRHPFGYSREIFFWALLSALTMLVIGAGLSVWRGVGQLGSGESLEHPYLALGVVLLSTMTNGFAVSRSVKKLREDHPSLRVAYRTTSRQLVKTALLQDSLGTASAVIGILSIAAYLVFGGVVLFDAIGALVLAGFMVVFAVTLVSEARSLIAGRAVPTHVHRRMLDAVRSVPRVEAVNRLVAEFFGSEEIRVTIDLDLDDHLTTAEVEQTVDEVQSAVRNAEPTSVIVSVDLNSGADDVGHATRYT